ncbi:TlpA disulfide reductase family protein [Pinibacter aurantiacus]|uniref:AhpC/TSA family protein n=1 Tax=Pinibacter aurantiacus TaxID=2851599 RepID=A0A9E2W2E7_9BACT|nr:TlpA disulfide reductase family protein [Pinibacter aurantiacus]MBV4355714.1 AhpC/TSA family protein [Pinibacter aurantiacus]
MKKYFAIVLATVAVHSANAQQFTLNGKITGAASSEKVKLYYTDASGKRTTDSTTVKDGSFVLKGNIAAPTMAYIEYGKGTPGQNPNTASFFIEPKPMSGSFKVGDFKNMVITGSRTQDEFLELENSKESIRKEMEPLSKAYEKAGEAMRKAQKEKKSDDVLDSLRYEAAAIHDKFEPYFQRQAQKDFQFFAKHPQSYVTAYYLRFHTTDVSLDSLQMFYNALGSTIQQSSDGKNIAREIEKLKAGSPGSVAKNFTTKDINGKSVSLADFKGKYVLIDFWASWCVPCRKSMPHVKELYGKYKDKGFDVIAVSDDDRDSTAWKKAIAKDGTDMWNNVLRGMDWEKIRKGESNDKDISEKFGIHSLPTKILIDKNGVIIGRYDKGTEEEALALDKKLAEVMND